MRKKEIPSIHQEHQVDRNLVEHALDLLEASRTPRDEPVPLKEGLELHEVMPESGIEAKKMLDELASSVLETSAQLHIQVSWLTWTLPLPPSPGLLHSGRLR